MAFTAKIRGEWRVLSPAMARVFRKRGVRVYEAPHGSVVHESADGEVTFESEGDFLERFPPARVHEMAPSEPLEGDAVEVQGDPQEIARATSARPDALVVGELPEDRARRLVNEFDNAPTDEARIVAASEIVEIGWGNAAAADDLSDEDLERLTAPE